MIPNQTDLEFGIDSDLDTFTDQGLWLEKTWIELSKTDLEAWGTVSLDAKVHIVVMVTQQSQNAAIKWRKLHKRKTMEWDYISQLGNMETMQTIRKIN